MKSAILGFSILCCGCVDGADFNSVPRQLGDAAAEAGCSPITEFYQRDGYIGSPYARHADEGRWTNIFAVACQSEDGDDYFIQLFSLELYPLETSPGLLASIAACDMRLPLTFMPGGLSFARSAVPLGNFFDSDWSSDGQHDDELTTGPIVIDTYYGLEHHYYCHEGKWLRITYH